MKSHNRRKLLSLHLSITMFLLSILLLVLKVETESVWHTVNAFLPTTTTTHSRRIIRISLSSPPPPQQQRRKQQLVPVRLKTSQLSLSVSSDNNSRNDSARPPNQPQPKLSNQQGKREMFNSIMAQPPTYSEGDPVVMDINNNIIPILDDSTYELINTIVMAADGRKADNIAALYVAHMTTMTSVLVVVSGNSRPQNQAICAAIRNAVTEMNSQSSTSMDSNDTNDDNDKKKSKSYYPQPSIEGTAESGWMILDYGSVMVHVMTPKSRLFYNVEGKWKQPQPMISSPSSLSNSATVMTTAIPLDLSHLLVPNSATITSNMLQQQQQQTIYPMDDDNDESDDDSIVPIENLEHDLKTYRDEVEDEKEEELDPFWS